MMDFIFTKTPLIYFVQNLWRDEAFAFFLAKRNVFDILVLSARDFSPPLYYLVLHFWMKIFGTSEIALRSVSLLFFLATIYVAYLFLAHILKRELKQLWPYLLLFLLNPFLNYFAFEARMYAMLAFFATCSFYFFVTKQKKAYIAASALGLYTHYFMGLVLLCQAAFVFITIPSKQERMATFKTLMTPLLFFFPWFLFLIVQHTAWQESFWILAPKVENLILLPGVLYFGYEIDFAFYKTILPLFAIFTYFLIGFGLHRLFVRHHKDREIAYLLLLWTFAVPVIVVLVSFFKPVFLPRYFIFSSVGLLLLISFLLDKYVPEKMRAVLIIAFLLFSLHYTKHFIENRGKTPIKKVVREIKMLAKPQDAVYVLSELNFHTAQYYFDENKVYIFNKTYQEIPSFVGRVLIPKEKIVNTLPLYPRRAFILKDDLTYDIGAIY